MVTPIIFVCCKAANIRGLYPTEEDPPRIYWSAGKRSGVCSTVSLGFLVLKGKDCTWSKLTCGDSRCRRRCSWRWAPRQAVPTLGCLSCLPKIAEYPSGIPRVLGSRTDSLNNAKCDLDVRCIKGVNKRSLCTFKWEEFRHFSIFKPNNRLW